MQKSFTKKQMKRLEKNSVKISAKMFEAAIGSKNVETIYACMRIITFLIATDFKTKEEAYGVMAELFDLGDSLLKETEELGFAGWVKK